MNRNNTETHAVVTVINADTDDIENEQFYNNLQSVCKEILRKKYISPINTEAVLPGKNNNQSNSD